MTIFRMGLIAIAAGAIALSGCQSNDAKVKVQNVDANRAHMKQMEAMRNPNVIPSADGMKQRTTNERGGTSYGLGSSVYSMIGSSGLHSDGLSRHLESRLGGIGVDGVSVFVFDDTVILATNKRETTASQYDGMQRKVLSGTGGFSARSVEPDSRPGTFGAGDAAANSDNLNMAAKHIEEFIGGHVHVLTIVGQNGVSLIERIRSYSDEPEKHAGEIASGIKQLLELASSGKP